MHVVPYDLDIDRGSRGWSFLLLGDGDLGTWDVLDSLSDLFDGLRGRLDPVFNVVELDADVVWQVALKDRAATSDSHGPGVDVLDVWHVGQTHDLLALAQDVDLVLVFLVVAPGRIHVGRG
ncbi:hypothetical protein ES703_104513 [subsurface metagenome]